MMVIVVHLLVDMSHGIAEIGNSLRLSLAVNLWTRQRLLRLLRSRHADAGPIFALGLHNGMVDVTDPLVMAFMSLC